MDTSAPLPPHTRLGPYEILSLIGAGGMGRVYKALDTRLDRIVAVKVSMERFSERFAREARAVASLNHPHICALYDVGENYLVMEYVDGHPLKGPVSISEALRLGGQIAAALDHAHRNGIVHRDLKPGNILVAKSGVKLLDFGLAAHLPKPHPAPSDETLTTPLTEEGTVMGTPQYMAPEQVEGKAADARTDIFASGAVLYELISGRRVFEGQSRAALMSAILTAEPVPLPIARQPLDRVVRTCLAKNPDDRWQSARDLLHALEMAAQPDTHVAPAKNARFPWAVAACLAALAVTLAFALARSPGKAEPDRAIRFAVQTDLAEHNEDQYYFYHYYDAAPQVSPDGSQLIFGHTANGSKAMLAVRRFDSMEVRPLEGTEGGVDPMWSPDSRQVVFVTQHGVKKLDLATGAVRTLSASAGLLSASGVSLSPDGSSILHSSDRLIHVIPSAGGPSRPVTQLDRKRGEARHLWPQFLPDGRRFLYLAISGRPENTGIFLGSLDSAEKRFVLAASHAAKYVPGYLLFVQGNTLMAQPVDDKNLRLSGEPVVLAKGIRASVSTPDPFAAFSVADRAIAFRQQEASPNTMVWYSRTGEEIGKVGDPGQYSNPALSPDGKRLAVGRNDPAIGTRDVWLFELERGGSLRLTFDPSDDFNPLWSPDGSRIAFSSNRKGVRDIYWKPANSTAKEELLFESDTSKNLEDWPVGGPILLNTGPGADLWNLAVSGERGLQPVIPSEMQEDQGKFSPDRRWLAYRSNETGASEIYIQAYPATGGKWRISDSGGSEPSWRGDGKELYFLNGRKMMAVDIQANGGSFQAGQPKLLFEAPFTPEIRRNRYVVSADGRKFLALAMKSDESPIQVILNWRALMKK